MSDQSKPLKLDNATRSNLRRLQALRTARVAINGKIKKNGTPITLRLPPEKR